MAQSPSNRYLKDRLNSGGTTMKAALYNGGTLNPDHDFMSSIDGTEVNTTGYAPGFSGSGRVTAGSVAYAQDNTNNRATLDCADLSFPGIGIPAGVAASKLVVYIPGTSDADSVVVAQYELNPGSTIALVGTTLTVTIDSVGLVKLQI